MTRPDTCVSCGAPIPEGRQVCPSCESSASATLNYRYHDERMRGEARPCVLCGRILVGYDGCYVVEPAGADADNGQEQSRTKSTTV